MKILHFLAFARAQEIFEFDGDSSNAATMFQLFEDKFGVPLYELDDARGALDSRLRVGRKLSESNSANERRQALIRIMFNVLSGRNRNNKSFIRELFNYGCHCYPGGSKNILKSGRGKPLDTIDQYCQQHKICYKCINSIFNDGQWKGGESRCNPAESSYKMIANMSAYSVRCSDDQNPCRRAICECDLHYAQQVTGLDFEANHNPEFLQRNGFDYDSNCVKRGNPSEKVAQCCGDRNSFPFPQILTKQKNECCANVAFNPAREECCAENVVAKIGKCSQY